VAGLTVIGWWYAPPRSRPPPLPTAAPVAETPAAPLPAAPETVRGLVEALAEASPAAAPTALFALWGQDYARLPGDGPCPRAAAAGLRCLHGSVTLATLRGLGLPAVLSLTPPAATPGQALLTALDEGNVTLTVAGRNLTLPVTALEPLWSGTALVLWKPPAEVRRILRPGLQGEDVVWLREVLDEALGPASAPPADPVLYDAPLRQRVLAFQESRGLTADGRVGDQTLLYLSRVVSNSTSPTLPRRTSP
jgi:general secretion pathway protein A